MVLGTAMQTYGDKLADEQEVLSGAADIIIDVYAAESVVLRAGQAAAGLHADAAAVFVNDAGGRVEIAARHALAAMADGDMLRTLLAALRRMMKVTPVNTVALRRRVADAVADEGISFLIPAGCKGQRGPGARVGCESAWQCALQDFRRRCGAPLLGLAGCTAREIPYEDEIASWHADKDRFMRESPESPVVAGRARGVSAASLLPDQSRRIACPASLTVARADDILDMQTSTGQRRSMQRIGALEFTLKGQPLKLTAFAEAADTDLRRLFVPFHDLTNGIGHLSRRALPRPRAHGDGRLRSRLQPRLPSVLRLQPDLRLSGAAAREPDDDRRARRRTARTAEVISAIVFDFDGVLVDSEPLHLRAYQEVLEPFGLSLPREKYYASYLGYDDAGVFTAVAAARDWPLDAGKLDALIEEKSRVFDALVAEWATAMSCIRARPNAWRGSPRTGRSGSPLAPRALRSRPCSRSRGLDRYFQFIVAAGETPAGKPAPDPYRKAAALHRHPPEACVAIEDSRWGIESAKAAGLWCIGITHTYPVAELLEADAIVTSLAELTPDLIRRLT